MVGIQNSARSLTFVFEKKNVVLRLTSCPDVCDPKKNDSNLIWASTLHAQTK